MGSNARGILKCLHARTGKKQQLRDVHNIIQSQKREMRGSKTSAERSVSAYAYELVAAEHRYAASVDADYDVINTGDANAQIVSREIRRKSLVSLQRFSCDCAFQQTMLLPCRHVFFARRFNRNETVIPPFSFYSQRWALRCPANHISQGEVTAGGSVALQHVERNHRDYKAMDSAAMYSSPKAALEKISDVMAIQTTPTFNVALEWLHDFVYTTALKPVMLGRNDGQLEDKRAAPTQNDAITAPKTRPKKRVQRSASEEEPPAIGTTEDTAYVFASPPEVTSLARKKQRVQTRAERTKATRKLARLLRDVKRHRVVTLDDADAILEGVYSLESAEKIVEERKLPLMEAHKPLQIRHFNVGQEMPRLEGCPTRDKIDEAITAIDIRRSDHALLAYWTDFGSIPYEQLQLVRRILIAGNAFREAKLTIEWVERAAWKEKYICPPFQDLRWIPKDIILVSTKKKIAGGYGGFNTSNSVVVGVVNFDGNHWVGFFGDREEKKAKMFDPLQSTINYT
ncbi:hypothetical protein PC129_g6130 [Phytophthora cactorum]|uniref:SWIM-type domain-containing protein n=1 Tax=Phytophthora cactorum TaxID=29920 RepID=A0A8T1ID88_9STRA|nr:hypothetical protein PC129_g6130 [Phytophthora cactorum]